MRWFNGHGKEHENGRKRREREWREDRARHKERYVIQECRATPKGGKEDPHKT